MSKGLSVGHSKSSAPEGNRFVTSGDWLNARGEFRFGRHKGDSVESIAKCDPGYLRWVISNAEDISEEDLQVIHSCLERWG